MKPLIRKLATPGKRFKWICNGLRLAAIGRTPKEAFDKWNQLRKENWK